MSMRIKVVIPNASVLFRDSQIMERKKAALPGTEVEVVYLPHGPVSIEPVYDEAMAAPYIIDEVFVCNPPSLLYHSKSTANLFLFSRRTKNSGNILIDAPSGLLFQFAENLC